MTSQGYSCSVSGDSCLPSVDDPAAPKDSPDSIRYDCSDGVTSCTWSSADSCGPSGSCVADRSYCVVKDPVVSPSPQPSPTVSGALDTIASKFFDQKAPGILDSKAPGSSGFSSSVSGSGTGYAPVPSGLPDSGLTRSCRMFDDSGFVYH